MIIVHRNGTTYIPTFCDQHKTYYVRTANLPFIVMGCRKGGPTLITIPVKMYWKQENRKRAVFSEFSMLLFCKSS